MHCSMLGAVKLELAKKSQKSIIFNLGLEISINYFLPSEISSWKPLQSLLAFLGKDVMFQNLVQNNDQHQTNVQSTHRQQFKSIKNSEKLAIQRPKEKIKKENERIEEPEQELVWANWILEKMRRLRLH